jgi:hypothetical protein
MVARVPIHFAHISEDHLWWHIGDLGIMLRSSLGLKKG